MGKKRYVNLLAENVVLLGKLSSLVKEDNILAKKSKQVFEVVVRLKLDGRVLLKDLASRSYMTAANISTIMKRLEFEKLVVRETDKDDRRNVWYSLSAKGNKVADAAIEDFHLHIENALSGMKAQDEKRLADALEVVNSILVKLRDDKS